MDTVNDWESPLACVYKILQEYMITGFEELLSVTQGEVSKCVMKDKRSPKQSKTEKPEVKSVT